MSFIQANDSYSLINVKGGTCMDLSEGDNVSIIGYGFHNGNNQAWTFENAGGDHMFYLRNKGANKYLSATAGESDQPKNVIASESKYQWRVEDDSSVDGGVRLSPAGNVDLCLDLAGHGDPTPGNPIQLWGRWSGQNQIWKLQKV